MNHEDLIKTREGEKLTCIKSGYGFTSGRKYRVFGYGNVGSVHIYNDDGVPILLFFHSDQFERVEEYE